MKDIEIQEKLQKSWNCTLKFSKIFKKCESARSPSFVVGWTIFPSEFDLPSFFDHFSWTLSQKYSEIFFYQQSKASTECLDWLILVFCENWSISTTKLWISSFDSISGSKNTILEAHRNTFLAFRHHRENELKIAKRALYNFNWDEGIRLGLCVLEILIFSIQCDDLCWTLSIFVKAEHKQFIWLHCYFQIQEFGELFVLNLLNVSQECIIYRDGRAPAGVSPDFPRYEVIWWPPSQKSP